LDHIVKHATANSLKLFVLELFLYAALIVGYYFWCLHFLGPTLKDIYDHNAACTRAGTGFNHRPRGFCWRFSHGGSLPGFLLALTTDDLPHCRRPYRPTYLIGVGFIVGLLGGFFGVGGSFLAGPALFAAGVPMNFVVGTDLAHIVGKSIVAARKHRTLGNIDIKLGAIMVLGTIGGVEAGAQFVQWLKRTARLDWVIGPTFIIVLLVITIFMTWEVISTWRQQRKQRGRRVREAKGHHHDATTPQWRLSRAPSTGSACPRISVCRCQVLPASRSGPSL
jgi:hypothetical protein